MLRLPTLLFSNEKPQMWRGTGVRRDVMYRCVERRFSSRQDDVWTSRGAVVADDRDGSPRGATQVAGKNRQENVWESGKGGSRWTMDWNGLIQIEEMGIIVGNADSDQVLSPLLEGRTRTVGKKKRSKVMMFWGGPVTSNNNSLMQPPRRTTGSFQKLACAG